MTHTYYHAQSSARLFGGKPEDYLAIHQWFDASKELHGDFRHRLLRHHSQGIYEAERVFGVTIKNSDGRDVPVRYVGEQHVVEDCSRVPTLSDWLSAVQPAPWMARATTVRHTTRTGELS
jgi:hypothetical protein